MYAAAKPATTLDTFVSDLEHQAVPIAKPPTPANASPGEPGTYAGSEKCGRCHTDVHRAWTQSGMARMLRPYRPENIIGDFEKNNEFYLGDDTVYRNGKLEIAPGPRRTLFARMTVRNGRHFFHIRQSDGCGTHIVSISPSGPNGSRRTRQDSPTVRSTFFPFNTTQSRKMAQLLESNLDGPGTERPTLTTGRTSMTHQL